MTEQYLEIIEQANKWVENTENMQGAKGETAYKNFVNFRRQLKKKKYALEDNPAAALYGESQVGKSYLASSLLSKAGESFNVIDGKGNAYDFIKYINPEGKGTEATSLITRFSTEYKWINDDFPVKAKLLSIADLILVLCDSYYNDVKAKVDTALKSDVIKERVNEVYSNYQQESVKHNLLTEDDILDVQDYFKAHFSTKASNVVHSDFFKKVSGIIQRIEVDKWSELFSLLWNNNQLVTELFINLLDNYKKLNYSNEVYIPIDAVLRIKGSLLDVTRLHEIYGGIDDSNSQFEANVSVLFNPAKKQIADNFSKSYLCALAAELIFRLPEDLEDDKAFLKDTDLLDFPGAKHRMEIHEETMQKKVVPQMLLRGKVAYLFNKYSHYEKINILLFCQHNQDSKQGAMPETLNNWIGDMIGKTPEERDIFIKKSKIPPLFVISTKFNLDLKHDPINDTKGNSNSLIERWKRRFEKALQKGVLSTETYNWTVNWTTTNQNFQNFYLLRDFHYSSDGESNVYKGYSDNDKLEKEEIIPNEYPDLRKDLKHSFLSYPFVKDHFKNPELAWESAASLNKDGSELIIKNLTVASANINEARQDKINKELKEIRDGILTELKKYYHDSDSDSKLKKAKSKAGDIQLHLDLAFGKDHFFFGPMIQDFMLDESEVYSLYQEKLKTVENRQVFNIGKYNGIRTNVKNLDPSADYKTNLRILQKHYEHESIEECEEHFKNQGIDLNELFFGNNERIKQFSHVLAEALEEYWFENYLQHGTKKQIDAFTEVGLQNTYEMLRSLFQKLEVKDKIAQRIRTYVDGNTRVEESYGMIADLSAEIINKFVNTVGIEYYTESDLSDLETANNKNKLGLQLNHSDLNFEKNTPEEAALLITNMDKLDQLLNQNPLPLEAKRLPNYRSYIKWYHLLKAGFVSVCDIPNYDVQANEKLKEIIQSCETA